MEWIHFPRIRTFVEKRFHGLFSKKEGFEIWGYSFVSKKRTRSGSSFPPEWATNSSRSISRHYWMTLNRARITARESCSRAVIPSPKNHSRKIARFFVSEIGPATFVIVRCGLFRLKKVGAIGRNSERYSYHTDLSRFVLPISVRSC